MNVYCPNCENECSDQATACPKCGRPLQRAGMSRGWPHDEIWALFLLGAIFVGLGIVVLVAAVASKQWYGAGVGLGAIWVGMISRAAAGMWGAIEHMADATKKNSE